MAQQHTLTEIAKLIGVSASTVSRVANNYGYVKPETRERVLEAMRVYNYVPNQLARNLKLNRSSAVGIIVPDIKDPFFTNIIQGMESILSQRGYSMVLCISNEDEAKESAYLEYMMRNMIDGVVLATVSGGSKVHERYMDSGHAIVFIDNLPRIARQCTAVITDNEQASRQAIAYLHQLGHRNIAIITGKQNETTGSERLAGYIHAMKELDLPVCNGWIRYGDFKGMSGYEHMRALLRENPEVTAVYVNSAQMTYGAVKAIQDAGLRMPKDISLIGFDIQNNTGMLESNITSIVQQDAEIGRIACETVIEALDGEGEPVARKILLGAKLTRRESCAPLHTD